MTELSELIAESEVRWREVHQVLVEASAGQSQPKLTFDKLQKLWNFHRCWLSIVNAVGIDPRGLPVTMK